MTGILQEPEGTTGQSQRQSKRDEQRPHQTGSYLWDCAVRTFIWSEGAQRLLRSHFPDGVSTLGELLELIHPDERERIREKFEQAGAGGTCFDGTFRLAGPGNSATVVRYEGTVRTTPPGAVREVFGSLHVVEGDLAPDEAAHASAQHFRRLYEDSPLGYQSLDEAGHFLEVNPAWLETLGYTRGEVIGRWFGDFLAPAYVEPFKRRFARFKAEGMVRGVQFEMVRRDGGLLAVEIDGQIGYDELGRFQQTHCILRDVTARNQAEAALRESEQELRTLYQAVQAGIILQAADGAILHANRTACEVFGMTEQEIAGKTSCDPTWQMILEDGTPVSAEEHPSMLTLRTGRPIRNTVRGLFVRRSEQTRWLLINTEPILDPETGKPGQVLITFSDITRRKQTEEALLAQKVLLSSIIESTEDAVFIKDVEGRYLLANSADAKQLGLPLSQVLGATDYDVFPRDIAEETRRADQKVIDSGAPLAYEQTYRRPGRKTLVYHINKYPRRDREGNLTGVIGIARDITERKEAEAAARESEERFRQIAENSGQVFWLTDWENRELLYVSPSYERVFGRSCQSAYENRRSWLDAVHPEDRARVDQTFARYGERGEYTEEEYRIIQPNGDVRWIRDRSIPVRDAAGKLYRWVSVAEDVTRRKLAEQAARESRQQMELALQGADLGIWDWNVATGDVTFNERWAEMLGHDLSDIEPRLTSWERLVHPDDLPRVEQILQAHLDGKTSFYEAEYRLRHKLGGWVWVLDKGKVIERDADGKPLRACGTHLDITDRKHTEEELRKSEEKYRGIFDESVATVYVFDAEKNFIDSNQAGLDLLGYSREELLSMSIPDVDADPEVVLPTHAQLLSGENIVNYEHQLKRKDGTLITVLNNSRALTDAQGNVIGMQSTLIDITERKQAEEAARESQEKLAGVLRSVTDHMSMMDEDLNIVWVNDVAQRLFGRDLVGKKCYAAYHRRPEPCALCVVVASFADGVAHERESEVIAADGSKRTLWRMANVARPASRREASARRRGLARHHRPQTDGGGSWPGIALS